MSSRIISLAQKGYEIGARRIQEQGLGTTLLWFYARGLPAVTGVPILKYSQVTSQLYVGPQFRQPGLRHLQKNGIHAIVNMRVEHDDQAHGLQPKWYCYLPTIDDQAPSIQDLKAGVEFITKMVESGEKVYIHCGAGVGRAPTMAAAYLISTGVELPDAIATIQKVRPFIFIMPPQMEVLKTWASLYKNGS